MTGKVLIFLSYAHEDEESVTVIYDKFMAEGFTPWMDKKDILPGELWKNKVRNAIKSSHFFLACFSQNSANKRGYLQREIKQALEMWQEQMETDIYLIPIRLEACDIPEPLHDFQWVDLFDDSGWPKLLEAIEVGIKRREAIAHAKPVKKRPKYQSMTEQIRLAGNIPTTLILFKDYVQVDNTVGRVAEGFNLSPEEQVVCITRLKKGNDVPFTIQTVYLKPEYCPKILVEDLTVLTDLYSKKYNIQIVKADEILRLALPNERESNLLNLSANEKVIIRDRISYDQKQRPVEVLHSVDCLATYGYDLEIVNRLRKAPSIQQTITQ